MQTPTYMKTDRKKTGTSTQKEHARACTDRHKDSHTNTQTHTHTNTHTNAHTTHHTNTYTHTDRTEQEKHTHK